MAPIIFLSATVKNATAMRTGTIIVSIFIINMIILNIKLKNGKVKTGFEPIFQDLQSNTFAVMLFNLVF